MQSRLSGPALAALLSVDPADSSADATVQEAVHAARSGDTLLLAAGNPTWLDLLAPVPRRRSRGPADVR